MLFNLSWKVFHKESKFSALLDDEEHEISDEEQAKAVSSEDVQDNWLNIDTPPADLGTIEQRWCTS